MPKMLDEYGPHITGQYLALVQRMSQAMFSQAQEIRRRRLQELEPLQRKMREVENTIQKLRKKKEDQEDKAIKVAQELSKMLQGVEERYRPECLSLVEGWLKRDYHMALEVARVLPHLVKGSFSATLREQVNGI